MAKQTLAVYDSCRSYLERFLRYAAEKKISGFELEGYTDLSVLKENLGNTRIKAVLFSLSDNDNQLRMEVEDALTNAGIYGDVTVIFLGEQHESEEEAQKGITVIEKYQSAEKILAEIRRCLKEPGGSCAGRAHSLLHLIGIYSPADKISHPREAAFLAGRIREKEGYARILYINLEQFSGMKEQLDYAANPCLSEIIYCYRTNQAKLGETLQRNKGSFMGMDVLTAPDDSGDLEEVGKKSWPDFLAALSLAGDYLLIILDMSVFSREMIDVILEYGNLYIPALPYPGEKDNGKMQMRMKEFRDYLRSSDWEDKAQRILEVQLGTD